VFSTAGAILTAYAKTDPAAEGDKMPDQIPAPICELHSRTNDGIEARLLWSTGDGRLWVAVTDTKTGGSFRLDVRDGEHPLDVFHHPYAYAARHGVETHPAVAKYAIPLAA
jgi:hypothetical protein